MAIVINEFVAVAEAPAPAPRRRMLDHAEGEGDGEGGGTPVKLEARDLAPVLHLLRWQALRSWAH